MDPVAPEHRHGGDGHGGVPTVDVGGFSFPIQHVDGAPRMEAPAPAPDDLAAVNRMPEAELLAAALEQEAKVQTLEMTLEELIKYSMTAPPTEPSVQRSQVSIPPGQDRVGDVSLPAERLRRDPARQTVYDLGNGGAPTGAVAAVHEFRTREGLGRDCPPGVPGGGRHEAPAVYDNGFRPRGHDGRYNERHGWPQQEVRGVPDRMVSGAYVPKADYPTRAFDGGALAEAAVP